jgi:hypothetical protein
VVVERCGCRAVVRGLDGLADYVGFGDPGALGVREDDGDGVAGGLQHADKVVDVRTGLGGGRPVVVDHLGDVSDVGAREGELFIWWKNARYEGAGLTKICIFEDFRLQIVFTIRRKGKLTRQSRKLRQ